MKAVIMAGGKGTRIASLQSDVPKPMIRICGKPILQWQIECLKKQGITEFFVVIGHLGSVITEFFGSGEKFGVSIQYIVETEPLGTAGALYFLRNQLNEDFLLINGDIIFDIDVSRFLDFHLKKGGIATLFTHPNDHPYDSGVVFVDSNGCVTNWLHKEDSRQWYQNRVNAGVHLLSPKILAQFSSAKKTDLDRDVLKPLISQGMLYAYHSPEYIKDMGTPERYHAVEEDIQTGKVTAKNLTKKQKAVFLDRDGTINEYVGFLRNIDDFVLMPDAVNMIRQINKSGYLAIVVTNQPVIARGEVDWDELRMIHNKMETLLGEQGCYIDDIYICPHHPDKGFIGERAEYKIVCDCRKPKPGMLLEAAQKYNIDLSKSYMVGDSDSDRKAGEAAGCKFVLVSEI